MSSSSDDKPEPITNPALEALRRHWAVNVLKVVLPVVLGSIAAYKGASIEGESAAAQAKHKSEKATAVVETKAEAGYQVTRQEVEALRARVTRLERALRAAKVPVRVAPPAAPAPLPPTLDKAAEQVKAEAEAAK